MPRTFRKEDIRLAAFDLDGTTLNQGVMSTAVESALRDLASSGVAIAIASGRDISQIPLNVLDIFQYRVTTNGASLTDQNDTVLLAHPMDFRTAIEALRILRRNGAHSCLYYNGICVASPAFLYRMVTKTDYASKSHRKSTKGVRKGWIAFRMKHYVKKNKHGVYKIQSLFKSSDGARKAQQEMLSTGLYNPVIMEDLSMETTYAGISKAHGLLELCKILGCNAENIIAFGDSANDLEMLKTAGFSVGMGNAEECVKGQVDYMTDPVTEDGVATAIRNLFSL